MGIRTLRRVAVGLGVALLLAGCGDDGGDDGDDEAAPAPAADEATDSTAGEPGSGASAPDCPFTAEDISAAIGEAMVQVDTPPCTFEPAEFPDTGPFISYRPSPPAVISQFGAGGSPAVEGLGDEAYFEEGSGNLAVRSGDVGFQIQLNEYDGDARATTVELAQGVLADL